MSYSEKRRYPRFDTDNFISYYLVDENGKIYSEGLGKSKNISKKGILLVTGKLVESNYILILAADEKNNIIKMQGKIAYSKKTHVCRCGTCYRPALGNPKGAANRQTVGALG